MRREGLCKTTIGYLHARKDVVRGHPTAIGGSLPEGLVSEAGADGYQHYLRLCERLGDEWMGKRDTGTVYEIVLRP